MSYERSWSWNNSWDSNSWSGNDWKSWDWGQAKAEQDSKEPQGESPAQRVEAILRRGHTVDQLTTEELHLIVNHIDKKQSEEQDKQEKKEKEQDTSKHEEGEPKPAAETKEERKKRLHARNMRYYRSLESCVPFHTYV